MDEGDKREVEKICWRTIFIAVVLVGIGIVIGRVTAGMCPLSKMGRHGGYGMKSCWKGGAENKCWMGSRCDRGEQICGKQWRGECKEKMGKCKPGCMCPKCCQKAGMCQPGCMCPMCCQKAAMCKPGCTCPRCLKKAACVSDPNKAGCPMTGQKADEPKKE